VEVVTVSLELDGADASRASIEAAAPEHPSLLDPTHQLDALFGVVNIPNVIWIDEHGMIVRPAEPGWPGPAEYPPEMLALLAERDARDPGAAERRTEMMRKLRAGQDRATYPDAIRDWARHGAASRFAMTPEQVIAASRPRDLDRSRAAAHFELAQHLWSSGRRDGAIEHFNACHRLDPDNWTYKRQAWSLVGSERAGGGELSRFTQVPALGEQADWPFASDFDRDVAALEPGEYYPRTLD
jgi:tetratricopeptide (TPR) repeat protein